ncbi:hypothetical protein [Vibrio anguillarum]|uniref:hypothetical protein n=1 Tax=Vibrio anguillarum TaxID=55601 RepID=UPI001F458823|nr:hypothetical protein [Vibrio anguillarum]
MAKTNELSRMKMTKNVGLTATPQFTNLRRRKYIERGLMLVVMIGLFSVASLSLFFKQVVVFFTI